MTIKLATEIEMPWVNEQYKKANFVESSMVNEVIALNLYENQPAGLGRLVFLNEKEAEIGGIYVLDEFRGKSIAREVVGYLVEKAKEMELMEVYCIPFAELEGFYASFGFAACDIEKEHVHEKVRAKYRWCQKSYDKDVLLLKLM